MTRTRALLVALGVVAAALLAVGVWFAVSLWPAVGQARELETALTAARESVGRLDVDAAGEDVAAAAAAAAALRATTESTAWSVATRLPVIGESAQAAGVLAQEAEALSVAALPLVAAVGGQDSTVGKVMAVLEASEEVAVVRDAAQHASDALAGYSPDGLRFGLGAVLGEAQATLPAIVSALDGLQTAAGPLAGMLGADGARTWLVMSQNPAEIRGSGGLFNAYLIVRVTDGNVEIVEAGSRKQLDGEFPRAEQIPYWEVVGPDTATTWGPVLGEWASFNIQADFPTTAELAAAGMAQRGTPVDGVVAIDPQVIAAILAGTGPVEHKGVTIDAATAFDFFTAGIYEDFPGFDDVAAKDALGMGLTYATIDAATKRPLDGRSLLTALQEAIAGGHLRAWSSDEADQAWLMTTSVNGSFAADPGAPVVAFANGTGGKLDLYVRRDVEVDTSRCSADGVVTVRIDLANESPSGLPGYVDVTLDQDGQPDPTVASGFTRTYASVYMPGSTLEDSSTLRSATVDGIAMEPWFGGTEGRPTWTVPVELDRGESAAVDLEFEAQLCPAGTAADSPS